MNKEDIAYILWNLSACYNQEDAGRRSSHFEGLSAKGQRLGVEKLNNMGHSSKDALQWVPGHVAVQDNEAIEGLVRQAAATDRPFLRTHRNNKRTEIIKQKEETKRPQAGPKFLRKF